MMYDAILDALYRRLLRPLFGLRFASVLHLLKHVFQTQQTYAFTSRETLQCSGL